MPLANITATDIEGVVYKGRKALMDPHKEIYARETKHRKLADAIAGADIFLGLSAPKVLKPDMVAKMAERPLVLALANPVPEIMPEEVKAVRPDAVIATGRSDYPNQVNNVLCFPFIFRGALDVGATTINEAMKIACVQAISDLAMAETSEIVAKAYGGQELQFGAEYLILDPAESEHGFVEPDLAAELERLFGHPLDQVLGQDSGKTGDVEDELLGVERGELAAQRRERIDDPAGGAPHTGVERAEQPGGATADDGDVSEGIGHDRNVANRV